MNQFWPEEDVECDSGEQEEQEQTPVVSMKDAIANELKALSKKSIFTKSNVLVQF
jgi:hypothetical protein